MPVVTEKKTDIPQPAQPAVHEAPQPQTASVQRPEHRRADDLSPPRRTADTRKRVETVAAEPLVSGSGQQVAEPVKSAPATQEMAGAAQVKGDTVIEQTLTIARDGAWLDRLAHDIARSASHDGNLHFKLNPQHLGALAVAISQVADGASIRMTADHETTRNILLDAQPRLMAEAQAHGLRISESHVELNQNSPQKQDQGQSQAQSQTQSQNPGSHQSTNQDMSRWSQGSAGQNGTAQNGQNRQSSPSHQPFVSNLGRKAEVDPESAGSDSDGLYA
jgi:flagellar hook-length control protein FliK